MWVYLDPWSSDGAPKTKATNITKEVFPSLIKQLWERCITAEHLQGGFRAAGLVPFNPKAVKHSQLAPSVVAEGLSADQITEGKFTATLTLHHFETPIRAELRGYFCEVLKPAEGQRKTKRHRRVQLSCVGGVLTSDEVVERIERTDAERAAKRRPVERKERMHKLASHESKESWLPKQPHRDRMMKFVVRQVYTDAESDSWIGCDTCETCMVALLVRRSSGNVIWGGWMVLWILSLTLSFHLR